MMYMEQKKQQKTNIRFIWKFEIKVVILQLT